MLQKLGAAKVPCLARRTDGARRSCFFPVAKAKMFARAWKRVFKKQLGTYGFGTKEDTFVRVFFLGVSHEMHGEIV